MLITQAIHPSARTSERLVSANWQGPWCPSLFKFLKYIKSGHQFWNKMRWQVQCFYKRLPGEFRVRYQHCGYASSVLVWWMCLWNAVTVHAYCTCVWSKTKIQQRMHTGISSYLPTGRAGDTTMVWVRLTHNTERRQKAEEQNRGTEKEKNENQKWMRWSWVSIHEIQGEGKGGAQSPKAGDGMGLREMAPCWRQGEG